MSHANGNKSAYPWMELGDLQPGLTKREWFAGMAMQGLLAHPSSIDWTAALVAKYATEQADAALAALEEKPDA